MNLADRALLAWEALVMKDERRRAEFNDGMGVTDSDVLDVIECWTLGWCGAQADFHCTTDTCCDYQQLATLVWRFVDAAAN